MHHFSVIITSLQKPLAIENQIESKLEGTVKEYCVWYMQEIPSINIMILDGEIMKPMEAHVTTIFEEEM